MNIGASFLVVSAILFGQPPNVRLPDETAGFADIAQTLVSVFNHADIVALCDDHGRKLDSDLRIALVRHPSFAKKVRIIVVEFGSTSQQSTLDRYIRGETVPTAQLEQVWKTTTQTNGVWNSPVYADFFAAVRDVNKRLPAEAQVRVFGGDPGAGDYRSRDAAAVSLLKEQVLEKHTKALLIYGFGHLVRTAGDVTDFLSAVGGGITKTLEPDYPGRTYVVTTLGGASPEYRRFESALKTPVRPVLVSLDRSPFRDFTAEEFIGRKLLNCRGARGCVSVFQGSSLTLSQMVDACVYFGMGADVDRRIK